MRLFIIYRPIRTYETSAPICAAISIPHMDEEVDARIPCRSVPAAHDEHWARGRPYDPIGDAAHQQPSHAGTPVGAHDHEIDAVLLRRCQHLLHHRRREISAVADKHGGFVSVEEDELGLERSRQLLASRRAGREAGEKSEAHSIRLMVMRSSCSCAVETHPDSPAARCSLLHRARMTLRPTEPRHT
jgi:hypothetical protein